MSEPFVGEIRMFAGNFAPRGWAFCDGQLLAVSQNDALFSLLGTIYGGDGRTTFGLPDMRGRLPLHAGTGAGLTQRRLGQKGGAERVGITVNTLPPHRHRTAVSAELGNTASVAGNTLARVTAGNPYITPLAGIPTEPMARAAVSATGGSLQHNNLMPALCVHFIIALFGIYPSRD
ncbi:MAG: tail fiber protein [Pseudomonadota bacterium]